MLRLSDRHDSKVVLNNFKYLCNRQSQITREREAYLVR